MLPYLARRLGLSAVMLLGVVLATFVLHHLLPMDPAAAVLGKHYSVEKADELKERLGLNDPLPIQFLRYLGDLAQGDLGRSHMTNEPVTEELKRKIPATVELGLMALIIASIAGVLLGVLTALKPRSWWDVAGLTAALAGVSLPIFWLAFLAIEFFKADGTLAGWTGFGGLPMGLRYDHGVYPLGEWVRDTPSATGFLLFDTLFIARDFQAFRHVVLHLILPATVLASVPMAVIARITRAALGEVLLQDYIRTAKAKGLSKARIIVRHALRNAAIPIVTSIGTQLGYLMGGAVLTETIFQWHGMGEYVVEAILNSDIKPLQASVLVVATSFVIVNLLVDMSYAWLDPRVTKVGE